MELLTNDLNVNGKINSQIDSDDDDDTPLQQRINNLQQNRCDSRDNKRLISQDPVDLAITTEQAQSHPLEIILELAAVCATGEVKTPKLRKRNSVAVAKVATKVGAATVPAFNTTASYGDEDLAQNCRPKTHANVLRCSSQRVYPEANESINGCGKFNECTHSLPEHPSLMTTSIHVKVEHADNNLMSSDSHRAVVAMDKVKTEIDDDLETYELEHIPLRERQRMRLSRQPMETVSQQHDTSDMEGVYVEMPFAHHVDDTCQQSGEKVKEESFPVDGHPLVISEALNISSSQVTSTESKSPARQEVLPANCVSMEHLVLPAPLVNVKVETLENGLASPCRNEPGISLVDKIVCIKNEMGVSWISNEDELDHMSLRERLKLLTAKKVSDSEDFRPSEYLPKAVPPVQMCKPTAPENTNTKSGVSRQRKRKKTATDCAETALEEDAPGLLQVLVEKGILLDEIKLYGGMESEDALDSSFDENSFEDLQGVISKLFSQREPLLKFAPLRGRKGSNAANYCLSCLISLVEQSRYLQFRKWPVEWGWCRDLQSFIFVFERHNRIVLERPEYGYATYFFELVNSLPVEWQIKRLVTTMKLTHCSRATIIENRSLLVGTDLSEGEARVLEEYGWIRDTGFGSMLNYCDRVVHDKSNERDGSEWRNKIRKLLMNGLNGGTIVLSNLPKMLSGYKSTTSDSQIKMEF